MKGFCKVAIPIIKPTAFIDTYHLCNANTENERSLLSLSLNSAQSRCYWRKRRTGLVVEESGARRALEEEEDEEEEEEEVTDSVFVFELQTLKLYI